MAWWQFWRRSQRGGSESDVGGKRSLMGRLFLHDVPYVLPKDMGEVNRLDFQHYMMRSALRGNYAAPIGTPDSILDVGSGTGRWAIEMATLFPRARVVGVDIAAPQSDAAASAIPTPRNYRFVTGNILEGLLFADAEFAFVHQRYMIGAIPQDQWPRAVADLVRVTRHGGWIELVEAGISRGGGNALTTVDEWVAAVLARRNLNIHMAHACRIFWKARAPRMSGCVRFRSHLGYMAGVLARWWSPITSPPSMRCALRSSHWESRQKRTMSVPPLLPVPRYNRESAYSRCMSSLVSARNHRLMIQSILSPGCHPNATGGPSRA